MPHLGKHGVRTSSAGQECCVMKSSGAAALPQSRWPVRRYCFTGQPLNVTLHSVSLASFISLSCQTGWNRSVLVVTRHAFCLLCAVPVCWMCSYQDCGESIMEEEYAFGNFGDSHYRDLDVDRDRDRYRDRIRDRDSDRERERMEREGERWMTEEPSATILLRGVNNAIVENDVSVVPVVFTYSAPWQCIFYAGLMYHFLCRYIMSFSMPVYSIIFYVGAFNHFLC